jgi:hypothetical protein
MIPGIAAAVAGGYGLSRWIFQMVVANRRRTLQELADRLAEQCADLAE